MTIDNGEYPGEGGTSFELYALGTGGASVAERSAGGGAGAADAEAVFYVKLSDMRAVFQFRSPTNGGGGGGTDTSFNDAIFDPSSDIQYHVFRKHWPTALKLNPSHAMLDRDESSGMLTSGGAGAGAGAGAYAADKSLVKHDFLRYIALHLFNTVHGVDLFRNEEDLRENIVYYGEVARVGIMAVLETMGTMSADMTMSLDGSGNRYSTNENTTVTNISRELMRQIAVSAPERLSVSSLASGGGGGGGGVLQSVPLSENDTLNFRVVMDASPNQHTVTNVSAIPSRSYNIKLIMKADVGGGGGATNTPVSDSVSFPNGYPYPVSGASGVFDISASNASVAPSVYADASPPVPIPVIRYGYQGWYYTNASSWVNSAPSVRNKINWYLPPNSVDATTVGDLRYIRLNLHIFSRVSVPFLTVYTKATGSGDAGGWYKSKRTYVIQTPSSSSSSPLTADNENYCFYMNWNGYSVLPFTVAHQNAGLSLSTVGGAAAAVGGFGSGEVVLAYTVGTDSGSSPGNVEFILSGVVIGEGGGGGDIVNEKEYGFIPA
jgi:hypothetical protein